MGRREKKGVRMMVAVMMTMTTKTTMARGAMGLREGESECGHPWARWRRRRA
jgi:hypothetical protein